ncbi:MAG: prolyl oligopeptidase family serine peptidase [Gemmataceae bacterium]
MEMPPVGLFRPVDYKSPIGELGAYLTLTIKDGKKHPAIIWIHGGDCNSIGDVWTPASASNDQTAAQYRKAGLVMMYPSLRGGNENPGLREGFYGEVDDILAAAQYLATQPDVDPERIYLGGHSTGGTLVLLVAAAAPAKMFRGVISFGPVEDVEGYGPNNPYCPFDMSNPMELALRAPIRWNKDIQTPTYIIEGNRDGNIESLRAMKSESKNANLHFFTAMNGTHFSILAPINKLIAEKIASDSLESITEADINGALR